MASTRGASWTGRIKEALTRSRESLRAPLNRVFVRARIEDETWAELEEVLVEADTGLETALALVDDVKKKAAREGISEAADLRRVLKSSIAAYLQPNKPAELTPESPGVARLTVYLLVGVNGSGKTTTAGKLAARFSEGHKVVVAAADTFRAAAIEQLSAWAGRAGAEIVKHQRGGDSAAVVFDAVNAASARKADILIVDTAGRLHTKTPLMRELEKIKTVVDREAGGAVIETLLVIDATTGQNGLNQAIAFTEGIGVDGVVLTKLDGTAKGGIVIAITRELGVPVRFVGVGEGPGDIADFDADEFAAALVGQDEGA